MNKILELIYFDYKKMPIKENPLETPEVEEALNSFFTTYFGHIYVHRDKCEQAWHRLLDIISAYQELAFETGFYAGIELMK
ncbi:MAG: hypothetical protein K2H19_06195 [Ruminococcus sp.]|nr:hypothetical protein [Ruminococcus sp.]